MHGEWACVWISMDMHLFRCDARWCNVAEWGKDCFIGISNISSARERISNTIKQSNRYWWWIEWKLQKKKNPTSGPSTISLNRSVDPILLLAVMWWINLGGERTSALRPPGVTHYNFSLKCLSDAPPWFDHNLWCHYKLISASIPLPRLACPVFGS